MRSESHSINRGHYGHNNYVFSFSPTAVKVQKKNPGPKGNKFQILGRGLHGHQNHVFSVYPCRRFLEIKLISLYGNVGLKEGPKPPTQGR